MTAVDKGTVARYYIECELDNIITGNDIQLREDGYSSNMPRLLEALSFTYRANGIFDYIEGGKYRWEKRVVSLEQIVLTGMGEALTDIIYSDEVRQSHLRFVDYIKNHSNDERLGELKPRIVPHDRQMLILREEQDRLEMLDGSHRLLSMVMNGVKSVEAYVAIAITEGPKPMIGDSVFLRLRILWQQTEDPLLKKAIENTVIGMIQVTSNGRQSVNAYWIKMAPTEGVRTIGRLLLETAQS